MAMLQWHLENLYFLCQTMRNLVVFKVLFYQAGGYEGRIYLLLMATLDSVEF